MRILIEEIKSQNIILTVCETSQAAKSYTKQYNQKQKYVILLCQLLKEVFLHIYDVFVDFFDLFFETFVSSSASFSAFALYLL